MPKKRKHDFIANADLNALLGNRSAANNVQPPAKAHTASASSAFLPADSRLHSVRAPHDRTGGPSTFGLKAASTGSASQCDPRSLRRQSPSPDSRSGPSPPIVQIKGSGQSPSFVQSQGAASSSRPDQESSSSTAARSAGRNTPSCIAPA